jgi:hypothetical protein
MVFVIVRYQDGPYPASGARDLVEVAVFVRARVDNHSGFVPHHPCVGSLQRVDTWVGRKDAHYSDHGAIILIYIFIS